MGSFEIRYNFMELEYLCGDKEVCPPIVCFNTKVNMLYLSWFDVWINKLYKNLRHTNSTRDGRINITSKDIVLYAWAPLPN
jgi:hypothetical protein